jgi:hypothetical protein
LSLLESTETGAMRTPRTQQDVVDQRATRRTEVRREDEDEYPDEGDELVRFLRAKGESDLELYGGTMRWG